MKSYTIEFNGSGEVAEGRFKDDVAAQDWVESVLEHRGYDADDLVSGDWDANGKNDDGTACERQLYWANDDAAKDDAGANAICQLCVVR